MEEYINELQKLKDMVTGLGIIIETVRSMLEIFGELLTDSERMDLKAFITKLESIRERKMDCIRALEDKIGKMTKEEKMFCLIHETMAQNNSDSAMTDLEIMKELPTVIRYIQSRISDLTARVDAIEHTNEKRKEGRWLND